ncbi:MAG: NADP-dependent 3-hydroxy acid dehydrogenase YdfG [Colwellia polaris]|jgi:NADP-dependent 3-hydroxy acid dehydrogenase YdfG
MKIFITGIASGIGKATTEVLLSEGHEVKGFDIDKEALDKMPDEVTTYHGDVCDEDRVEYVVNQEEFDILINCAAYYELGSIEDMSAETVESIFKPNVFGTLNFIRESMPMLRERNGRIINMSSVAGKVSMPYYGVYSATKHSIEAISDALRMEVGRFDVDVVIVEPGAFNTGFNSTARQALIKYVPDSIYADDYEDLMEDSPLNGESPVKAGRKVAEAAIAENPKTRYKVGRGSSIFPKFRSIMPDRLYDKVVLRSFRK